MYTLVTTYRMARDGKSFQLSSSVPFCLHSRYVVCQAGLDGLTGPQGAQGEQGPAAVDGQPLSGQQGPQGDQGPQGVPIIERQATTPQNPGLGRVYLDDGSNTSDGNPGFRYYDGNGWIDL